MHKVFISYHHENDQSYKNELVTLGEQEGIFISQSVDIGDISDDLTDEAIRIKIRDEYLQDSTVTIVLVGTETKNRKHVDWEIYSSMFDGIKNKKSGIIVAKLPTTQNYDYYYCLAPHSQEQELVYSNRTISTGIDTLQEARWKYPNMPSRIIDNIINNNMAKISVTFWECLMVPDCLKNLIYLANRDRRSCKYNLNRKMRRYNS